MAEPCRRLSEKFHPLYGGFREISIDVGGPNTSIVIMSDLALKEIHDFAVALAKNAGAVILKASNSRLSSTSTTTEEKKNCLFLPKHG
jgi:hypothetical protein